MGRKPLGNQATQVRMPKAMRDRITEKVGKKGMSAFIRRAIEAELARLEAKPEGGQAPNLSPEPEASLEA